MADVDGVTYWRAFGPGTSDADQAEAAFVRRAAAAYEGPAGLPQEWRDTSGAAARAAAAADPGALVATQGHVLRVDDLVSTLVVEATVHLLDLTLEVPGGPPSAALVHTRGVLEQINGAPLPSRWDDVHAVLVATGRTPLDDDDRVDLGRRAADLPLLG